MSNILYVMELFDVDEKKAEELIASGLNVNGIKHGWSKELNSELTVIDSELKSVVETFFSEDVQ